MVTITAGRQTVSTGVQFRTNCPVYEQGFSFLIHNPKTDSFTLKVSSFYYNEIFFDFFLVPEA